MTVPHSTLILSWGKDFHLLSLEKNGKSQRRLQLGSGSLSYILHVCVGLCVHPLNLEELDMCWPTQSVSTGHCVLSSLFRVAGSRAALWSLCSAGSVPKVTTEGGIHTGAELPAPAPSPFLVATSTSAPYREPMETTLLFPKIRRSKRTGPWSLCSPHHQAVLITNEHRRQETLLHPSQHSKGLISAKAFTCLKK